MKFKALIIGVALVSVALAGQATIRLTRSFKVGDADAYKFHIIPTMALGDADVTMKINQTVKKVYDNGEADIENSMADFHVMFNGTEVPAGNPDQTTTVHVDKHGMPTQMGKGGMAKLQFVRFASAFFDRDLKEGDTIPIDFTDPANPKTSVKGSAQVASIANGEAKIVSDMKITDPDFDTPANLHMVSFFDVATSKPNRVEGDVTNINIQPDEGAPPITAMKFVMERVK